MYAITATKIQDPPKRGQSPKIDPSGDSCPGSIHAGTAPQAPYVTTSPASRGGELAARNEPQVTTQAQPADSVVTYGAERTTSHHAGSTG
jgi:hypothetical protein